MRKHIGSGMMIGLTLLAGCSQAPRQPTIDGYLARVEASRPPRPVLERPVAGPGRRTVAGGGLPARWSPARPVETRPRSPVPETFAVRVSPGRVREAADPPWILPASRAWKREERPALPAREAARTSSPDRPTQPAPEVILLEVATESAQGVSRASWIAPVRGEGQPEASPVVTADLRKPERTPGPSPDSLPRPAYGRAPDYSWLTGELLYLRARKVWRLRYAPPDQPDRHGGTVVLVGEGLPPDCKSGQVVRVEGQLVNPDTNEPRPPYWVRSLQVLQAAPVIEE